jgi:hypothetical protein
MCGCHTTHTLLLHRLPPAGVTSDVVTTFGSDTTAEIVDVSDSAEQKALVACWQHPCSGSKGYVCVHKHR